MHEMKPLWPGDERAYELYRAALNPLLVVVLEEILRRLDDGIDWNPDPEHVDVGS